MPLSISYLEGIWKAKHPKSRVLFEQARQVTPGGAHHPKMVNQWHTEREVYPFYVTKAEGTKLWDVDGNIYTDYFSHAATFLGHTYPEVIEAIREYAPLGPFSHDFTEINLKLVKKITKMVPCAEIVDCVNSGTEATMGALRYARAYTGRSKIIRFRGAYHGWGDQLVSEGAGIPKEVLANIIEIPENDTRILEQTIKEESPAAVIFHFAYGSGGGGMAIGGENPLEFMKTMREIANEHDALLIADEVVTGFRYAPGGAQQYFGIDVDMAALGKMVGGAICGSGAIVGKREIMEMGDPKKRVYPDKCARTEGTFSGNPLTSAAGHAALDAIDKARGKLNDHANRLGERFRNELNEIFQSYDFPACAVGCCSTNGVAFTDKSPTSATDYMMKTNPQMLYKWHMYLATHCGIYTYPGSGGIFISAVHTEADIDSLVEGTEEFVRREKQ